MFTVSLYNPLRGRIRWLLVGWMFTISAIAYLDRVNISIAGSSIQKEFGLDNIQLGWVFSSFVLGYALFQAPGGRLADRFGPRKILAIATVWWAVFTSLSASRPGMPAGTMAKSAVNTAHHTVAMARILRGPKRSARRPPGAWNRA